MLWKSVLFCFLRARLWIPLLLPSCYGGLKPWAKWIFPPLNCYHPIVIIQLTNAPYLHRGKYSLHSTHSAPLGLSAFFPVRTPMDAAISCSCLCSLLRLSGVLALELLSLDILSPNHLLFWSKLIYYMSYLVKDQPKKYLLSPLIWSCYLVAKVLRHLQFQGSFL